MSAPLYGPWALGPATKDVVASTERTRDYSVVYAAAAVYVGDRGLNELVSILQSRRRGTCRCSAGSRSTILIVSARKTVAWCAGRNDGRGSCIRTSRGDSRLHLRIAGLLVLVDELIDGFCSKLLALADW